MLSSTGKKIGLALLTASSAACGAFFYLRRKKKTRSQRTSALTDAVAAGIGTHAVEFDGLYESLYLAEANQEYFFTEAYGEWCDRVQHIPDPAFRSAFNVLFSEEDMTDEPLCRRKHALLLECIQKAGIIRHGECNMTGKADEAICRYYIGPDGQKLQIGDGYIILKAAWYRGDRVVEYGMTMDTPEDTV